MSSAMTESVRSSEDVSVTWQVRSFLPALKWIAILGGLGAALHFGLQAIIQSGPGQATRPSVEAILEDLAATDPARAERVRAGMEKYNSICRLCHNRTGQGGKFTPSLAGKGPELIVVMLRLYRDGHEVGPLTGLMAPWAKDLTDEEIENLAAYIATL